MGYMKYIGDRLDRWVKAKGVGGRELLGMDKK